MTYLPGEENEQDYPTNYSSERIGRELSRMSYDRLSDVIRYLAEGLSEQSRKDLAERLNRSSKDLSRCVSSLARVSGLLRSIWIIENTMEEEQ